MASFLLAATFILALFDTSLATFTSPARGTSWALNSTHQVKWETAGMKGPLQMHLCPGGATDLSSSIVQLAPSIPNTGSWTWYPQSSISQHSSFTIIIIDVYGKYTYSPPFYMVGWPNTQYQPPVYTPPQLHSTSVIYTPPQIHTTSVIYTPPQIHTTAMVQTLSSVLSFTTIQPPPVAVTHESILTHISAILVTSQPAPLIKTVEVAPIVQTHEVAPIVITEIQAPLTKTIAQPPIITTEYLAPIVKTILVTETPAPIVKNMSQPALTVIETQPPVLITQTQAPVVSTIQQPPSIVTEQLPPVIFTEHVTKQHTTFIVEHTTPPPIVESTEILEHISTSASTISFVETFSLHTSIVTTAPVYLNTTLAGTTTSLAEATTATSLAEATSTLESSIVVTTSATAAPALGFSTSVSVGGAAASTGFTSPPASFTGAAGKTHEIQGRMLVALGGLAMFIF